jgi:hypothetical protein
MVPDPRRQPESPGPPLGKRLGFDEGHHLGIRQLIEFQQLPPPITLNPHEDPRHLFRSSASKIGTSSLTTLARIRLQFATDGSTPSEAAITIPPHPRIAEYSIWAFPEELGVNSAITSTIRSKHGPTSGPLLTRSIFILEPPIQHRQHADRPLHGLHRFSWFTIRHVLVIDLIPQLDEKLRHHHPQLITDQAHVFLDRLV